jgi:hypothetical protein
MIKVTNSSSHSIKVAINHWGDDGQTGFFTVSSGGHETWGRSDVRGFVMSVNQGGNTTPYYVLKDSNITVSDSSVTDGDNTIPSIGR